jgi:hypothetical protein
MALWKIERPKELPVCRLTYTNADGATYTCGMGDESMSDQVIYSWIVNFGMWVRGDVVELSDGTKFPVQWPAQT